MSSVPDCALVRGYVLNNLEHGAVRVADLIWIGAAEFGFTYGEIEAAGEHFGVISVEREGELFWMRPANLFAIWWAARPAPSYERCRAARRGDCRIMIIPVARKAEKARS